VTAKITRRSFTQGAAAIGTLAALNASSLPNVLGANERVRLGVIGVGNRGDQLLDAFLPHEDCTVAALCDVYEPYLPAAQKKVGGKAELFHDFRKLLERKDLDAIVIATPDHWHALQFVAACRADKDVYCEKPLSLTIGEGRFMADAAKKAGRITQVGLHRRSAPFVQEAVQLLRDGGIGTITVAKAYHLRNESPMGIGKPTDGEVPEGLDWDFWLGPAPKKAFNRNRCLYKFRWFWDYSGGQLTNFGTHYLDVIQWALGQDAPRGVFCTGGKYAIDDNRDIPDTLEAVFEYDGALVTFSQFNANASPGNQGGWELEFRGTKGTLLMYEGRGYTVVPEQIRTEELPALSPLAREANAKQSRATKPARDSIAPKNGKADTAFHTRNFLDCVKSRKSTNCPVEVGHRSTSATLLARVSLMRKQYLTWDAQKERVTNDPGANKLLSYDYRAPWKLV
jgi:predicted dehydrogenase